MAGGFGRTEVIIGVAGLAIVAVATLWLLGGALYDALPENGGWPLAERLGFAVGLVGGLVGNEHARGRFQEQALDQAASGLAIVLGIGAFVLLYGSIVPSGRALSG